MINPIPFDSFATNMGPLGKALVAAWSAFRDTPEAKRILATTRECGPYDAALARFLTAEGFTVPSTHSEVLMELRKLAVDMMEMSKHGDGDAGPFGIWRDKLEAAMAPARSLDDAQAQLARAQDSQGSVEWLYLDSEDRKRLMAQAGRDLLRLSAA